MKFSFKEKLILFALASIQFIHIVDFMILMPLGPQLMRNFKIGPSEFGFLVSAYTFAAGASGLLSALFLDRFDRKKSLLFFFVGFALGTLACAFSPNYGFLLVSRLLTGTFGGVLGALVLAIVGDVIAPEKRGTAMGIVMTAFSLASIFGVPFSLFLANQYTWHAPFVFLVLLSIVLFLLILFVLPPVNEHLKNPNPVNPFRNILNLLEEKSPRMAILFMGLLMLAQFMIIPFLSPSLVANAGMKEVELPFMYMVGGIGSMLAAPLVGRMSDKFGKVLLFRSNLILSLFPVLLISHLGVTPFWQILTVACFFFIFTTGRAIPAMALVTSTVKPQRRGSFMSLLSSIQQFAGAIGAFIAGSVVQKASDGSGQLINYDVIGMLSIALSLVAFFLVTRIKTVE